MEIRQLRALIAVADTGSVTRAARVLHVVQPAVTRQIASLETELGVSLFERTRAGMRLTAVGEQVLHRARRALHELDRAREEAGASGDDLRGLVTIGLLPSSAHIVGPRIAAEVAAAHPGIRLRLTSGYAGYLAKWLEGGDVDVALLFDQPLPDGFRCTEVSVEEMRAIAPPGAVEDGQTMPLADVLGLPLILPSSPHGLRTLIESAAAKLGVDLAVPFETNEVGLQRSLVAEGHGWSLLPSSAVNDSQSSEAVVMVVTEPTLTRTLVIARPGGRRSAAVDAVSALLGNVIDDVVASGVWSPMGSRLRKAFEDTETVVSVTSM
ncbi:LysR family transcriptional regulator [Rhodococcus sp. 06-156-3C]|uniref:LysR family transcriptional regulator n=1 Tax=Nocardiaceae TaxID=85025 RepID=UPI00068C1F42|nr:MULTISPECIES: LysR family transcriptional regulator [Rhodococcus]OZD08716.1 LysR family transcriptional regulator [Rhodococcus sp. 06-156-4C]OZD17294.1 LysR family transcriptional regulator [Rhodococcus sp. 06-156-3C]OZD18631.1 LysR family transcriptional regulator [Rhodococcus sp. 06-156-4a]OZD25038.1 LysR family transcriptional regulator [Rhodococcus sp. 06-156-3b]OZD34196.1 LysR family transcriptional regulator [Rhodococcus sp. 06-156-3]